MTYIEDIAVIERPGEGEEHRGMNRGSSSKVLGGRERNLRNRVNGKAKEAEQR
jgi:hypothetical protein